MRQVKQSGWYCFRIASTIGSRGPSALWQKAQMSARSRKSSSELHASVSLSGDEPMHSWVSPYLWSFPSPSTHSHPATAACLLAPGKMWAASIQQGKWKGPDEWRRTEPCHLCPCRWGN